MTRAEFIDLEDGALLVRQGNREFTLHRVHSPKFCEDRPCVVHNPTEHIMSDWTLIWRDDRGFFERLCVHGVGHVDPDQEEYFESIGWDGVMIHGCDGCCAI